MFNCIITYKILICIAAQPWFEMQENAGMTGATEESPPAELVSVRAADYPEEAACNICQDKFESFYNEEKEEWQLRNALDVEGKLAHPLCIEDQKVRKPPSFKTFSFVSTFFKMILLISHVYQPANLIF